MHKIISHRRSAFDKTETKIEQSLTSSCVEQLYRLITPTEGLREGKYTGVRITHYTGSPHIMIQGERGSEKRVQAFGMELDKPSLASLIEFLQSVHDMMRVRDEAYFSRDLLNPGK